ncbi:MAG TPA: M13-type metalloendopeptidase [Acidimicrobiales bacterium]|nr:M13-type metalloendopeptidase [Acidimicrobiales bacterium]
MTERHSVSGIAVDDLSEKIRPQDDLFHHVNQRWIERTAIPADKASYGSSMVLREEAEKAVRAIVEEAQSAPSGSEARKFGDLYTSFMDETRVEALGADPLFARLELVARVASTAQLLKTIGELQSRGLSGFYELFVDNDPGNPERYLVFFEQGGLSLPDESYYREEHFASIRAAFVVHVRSLFELAGLGEPQERAERVCELETEIAKRHWDNVASRDSEKTYNLVEWREALDLFHEGSLESGVEGPTSLEEWSTSLVGSAHPFDEVVLRQPSFTHDLAELFDEVHFDAWKDWLSWRVISGDAPYLSSPFVAEHFDFYGRTLTGAQELRARWKRGVSLVEGAMGEAVGQIYVDRHFPPVAKERMDVLVTNLVEAYRQSITTLEWMSGATRERALEKLRAFTPKIGYPPRWRDYSLLEIDPSDLLGNVRAANVFEFQRQLAKVGQPIDRDEWFMTPQTVNAYYNPGINEIVFPAAILQPPFFDVGSDDAANYGGIGAVIGHEIGHGFDDQGSKFDGTGRLTDWWTPEDRMAFEERTSSLIAQYDALSPSEAPDQHVNGALTIGENIGDLGGVGIAWQAYLISLNGEEPPTIDGLSAAQRFFLSWAQSWQYQARAEEVGRRLAVDPHSPPQFRCNQIVRNLDEFYDAFGVVSSDALWLDPVKRVTIW